MSGATRTIEQRINVTWEFPVTFTHGLFLTENRVLADTMRRLGEERRHRALVFVDSHVAAARPSLVREIENYFAAFTAQIELATDRKSVV